MMMVVAAEIVCPLTPLKLRGRCFGCCFPTKLGLNFMRPFTRMRMERLGWGLLLSISSKIASKNVGKLDSTKSQSQLFFLCFGFHI